VAFINEDWELHDRARAKVAQLSAYEQRHPRQGPDTEGRPYDPWRDVIRDPFTDGWDGGRAEIDEVRTAIIPTHTWEGFAWANHRFVLSDERGNSVIVGYNEDARQWFMDPITPVRLSAEWVAEFMASYDPDGLITGLEEAGEIHDAIVRTLGGRQPTIPSYDELAEFLSTRRAAG
jgi:hypothetical protein